MTQVADASTGTDLGVILLVLTRLGLTGRLRVSQDGWTGDVSLDQGEIVAAEFGTERGWPALEAILLVLLDGQCTFSQEAPTVEPNVTPSVDTLENRLTQAVQRRARIVGTVPSLAAVPQMREPPADWRAGADVTLPRSALSTLIAVDGHRTVGELCLGHRLARTLEDLALLVDLGLVAIVAPAGPTGPPGGARPPVSAPSAESQPPSPRVWGHQSGLQNSARHTLSSLVHTLHDGREMLLTSAKQPGREARWFVLALCLTAIAIGLVLSLQAVVGRTAASTTALGLDSPLGAAQGGPAAAQVNSSSSSKPRVLLDERFASGPGDWPNNPQSTAWLADGAYRLGVRQPGQFVAVGAPVVPPSADVVVSATLRKSGGPPGSGYGLIVRDQGPAPRDGLNQTGNFYVLVVNDRGEVGMSRREGDHWVELLPWTPSEAVHPGTAANELIALAVGPQLGLVVNGTLVASREDRTLTTGAVGLYVGGDESEVTVERLRVEELPANSITSR
jgi:hypothetical protein